MRRRLPRRLVHLGKFSTRVTRIRSVEIHPKFGMPGALGLVEVVFPCCRSEDAFEQLA